MLEELYGRSDKIININNCHNIGKIKSDVSSYSIDIGQIAGINNNNGTILNSSYLKSIDYSGVGINNGTDESIAIENEKDMPSILDIVGSGFKNGTSNYPILNWQ